MLSRLESPHAPVREPHLRALWNAEHEVAGHLSKQYGSNPGRDNTAVLAAVLAASRSERAQMRRRALKVLSSYAEDYVAAEQAITGALLDPDHDVRNAAVSHFYSSDAAHMTPRLFGLLSDPEPVIRAMAAGALVKLGEAGEEMVPNLVEALVSVDPDARSVAADSLKALGRRASAAVPALLETLADEELSDENPAVFALNAIGPLPLEHLAALDRLLADSRVHVRLNAARVLQSIPDEAAKPRILVALEDVDLNVCEVALEALQLKVRDDSTLIPRIIPSLIRLLASNDRNDPFHALLQIGSPAVPVLIDALRGPCPLVRYGSALCLAQIGRPSQQILAALIDLAEKPDPETRRIALEALEILAPKAPAAADALRRALRDRNPSLRLTAARSLWTACRERESTVPVLIDLLRDTGHRIDAIDALNSMGPAAKEALPALKNLARSRDCNAKAHIRIALKAIGQ